MPASKTIVLSSSLLLAAGLGGAAVWLTASSDPFAECGGGMATGAASIGGPFTLISETGERMSSAALMDRPTLIYFGYTFCPDVCPVDAATMARTADLLAERGHSVRTAFVSVDPERDTPDVLAAFTDALHPEMVGLTGTPEEVEAAKSAYRVYAQRAPGGEPEYYLVDHSAFTYLMAAEDRFLAVFRHGVAPEEMAETAACYIRAAEAGA